MSVYSATVIQVPDSKGFLLTFTINNLDNNANKSIKVLRDVLSYDWGGFKNFSLPVVTSHKENKYTQLELSFYHEDVHFGLTGGGEIIVAATTNKDDFLQALDKALSIAG